MRAPRPAGAAAVASVARAATAAAAALPQPVTRPSAPPRRRPKAVPRPARRDLPAGARVLAWLRTLPDHRLLDRLIGGRVWIVLIGTLLVGIVTMQLTLLRLNAGIGVAVERSAALEQRNAELRLSISRLSDSARIVALGSQMGLVTPPQGSPRFVTADAGDAGRALTTMRVPDPVTMPVATTVAVADTTVATPDSAAATTVPAADATTTTSATTADPAAATTPPATGAAPSATDPATATTAPVTTSAGGASAAVVPQG